MNYRHAYHAGNFADVVKHAVFAWLIERLQDKDTPLLILDTHAGVGRYDLHGVEAQKTGEAEHGVLRVWDDPYPALAPWRRVVAGLNRDGLAPRYYPGSPEIARKLARHIDQIVLAELHRDDARALARMFASDPRITVIAGDGYQALKTKLPPPSRRGLVLIDPPFERDDEFVQLMRGLRQAHRRFASGQYLLWYPIKSRAQVAEFHAALAASGIRRIIVAELLLHFDDDPGRLNGTGLVLVNPPWQSERTILALLKHLARRFAAEQPGRARVETLVPE
jgi:23S rRNA (adenine2030-N6)-methyltransferase